MASAYFESRYGNLYYDRLGLGDPLVLVHGLYTGASGEEFLRNTSALQKHFTVYNVDLLGFGSSDAPRLTHSAELHQHLLRDFLTEVVGGPARVVASGGACGIAVRLGVYDDALLSRLVLICPTVPSLTLPASVKSAAESEGFLLVPDRPLPLGNRLAQFIMSTLATGKSLYDVFCSTPTLREFLLERYVSPKNVTEVKIESLKHWAIQKNGMYAFLSLLNGYFDVDVPRWLRYVRAPALIVWGQALGDPPTDRLLRPASWSQGKELVEIKNAKYWPHDERSGEFNEKVVGWLKGENG